MIHFYHTDTGHLHEQCVSTSLVDPERRQQFIDAATPAGHKAIEGNYDRSRHKVDLISGKIVHYQPEAPSDDHEWLAEHHRWVLKPHAQARETAKYRIKELEGAQNERAMRELLLAIGKKLGLDAECAKLEAVEKQIQAHRDVIRANAVDPNLTAGA